MGLAFLESELITILANRSVNLNISRSCFTKCKGCYNYFSPDKNLIELNHISDFLHYLYDNKIANKVTFGGGDPLSRPDILDILDSAKALNFKINLDTVGSAFLKDTKTIFYGNVKVKKVEVSDIKGRIDLLGIPIDGSDNEIATTFRTGRNNFMEEQLAILDLLEEYNIPVCINTVLSDKNYFDIERIAAIIERYNNIQKWQIFQYMPIGRLGAMAKHIFSIDENTYLKAIEKAEKRLKSSPIIIEGKTEKSRRNVYCMIDSSGLIWLPTDDEGIQPIGNIKDINYR